MPYTIKKFNGQTVATIQDGTVDSVSTDLNLPGKNYAGYGRALNESLVFLLENFANSIEPPNKLSGQLWFDTSIKKIKVYNGINFKTLGSIEYGATSPAGQLLGDQWFNTVTNQLFVYDGTEHKLIGPLLTNPNAAQLTSKRLIDTGGNIRTVLQANFEDSTIAMFSKDEFDINSTQTPVIGFSKIFKGITLPSRLVYPNVKFGGVAKTSESLLVNNIEVPASSFVQNTGTSNQVMNTSLSIRVEPTLNSSGAFTSLRGLFLGGADNFFVGYNAGTGYINNLSGSNITLSVTTSGALSKILTIGSTNILPEVDSVIDLGSSASNRFKRIYANNFYAIDNPALAPNNSAFYGKVEGTTVNASVGFVGKLTGNIVGDIEKVDGTKILNTSGITPVFSGRVNGNLYGNVVNLNAPVDLQNAIDVSGVTTTFRGAFSGISESTATLRVTGVNYPGLLTSVNSSAYRNTVAIRDNDGNLSAVQFLGVAQQATSVLDQNQIPRVASIANTPYTVVIRDSDGRINVGNISGTATNADRLSGMIASVLNTPSTIVARDAASDIFVNIVHGTATAAQYADLAEKYLADADYDIGTVMMIGGEKEVTASRWGKRAIGAVSAKPAYLMNEGLEGGTVVGLKGRIPVKVIGAIKKGDDLISSDNGCAVMAVPHANGVFAVALESSDDTGVKLVECLIL
jgi:hypothetical protein